MAALMLVKDLF